MLGMSAIGEFAVAMLGLEAVIYEPVSRLGGMSSFTESPQRFATLSGVLTDDDLVSLTDDDGEVITDDIGI